MKISTGKPLSRRTALRNMGAAAALPLVAPADSPAPRAVEGKVALVTGSGRNLGRATVLELARQGADVVVNARSNRAEADAVAREAESIGVRAIALLADVGIEQQVNQMVDEALERFGRIELVVAVDSRETTSSPKISAPRGPAQGGLCIISYGCSSARLSDEVDGGGTSSSTRATVHGIRLPCALASKTFKR